MDLLGNIRGIAIQDLSYGKPQTSLEIKAEEYHFTEKKRQLGGAALNGSPLEESRNSGR